MKLSLDKFGSNVLDQCLLNGSDAPKDVIVGEMLALVRGAPRPFSRT
ncbi:hypothetical protein IMZ48_30805 [Candidatus Bathyarchaeota archaeon]|nr:hypothetical protein [Candidatus Bathyarchaeota archaeon]